VTIKILCRTYKLITKISKLFTSLLIMLERPAKIIFRSLCSWIFTILQRNRSLRVEKNSFTPMCSVRTITVWFYFVRFRFTSPLTSWSNIVKWRVRSLNIPKRRSSVSLIGSESQFGSTSPSKWRAISTRLVHTMTCNPLFRADQQIASREERFCWKI